MTKPRRHKWKRVRERTRRCKHCGWIERYKFFGKKGPRVWWERDGEKVTKLPKCASFSTPPVKYAVHDAQINVLEKRSITQEKEISDLRDQLAQAEHARDAGIAGAQRAGRDRDDAWDVATHWISIVCVLRRRLSEQAKLIRIYENGGDPVDADPQRNVTAGLLHQEQEEVRRVNRHRWAAEHEVVRLQREVEALGQHCFAIDTDPGEDDDSIEMNMARAINGEDLK